MDRLGREFVVKVFSVGAFLTLLWGAGIASHVSPAHGQEVTEDWPQIVSRALINGNCETALDLIRAAQGTKDALADVSMGRLREFGACVPQDVERAMELYLSAAQQELREAYPLIGYMYLKGRGTPPDPDKAKFWFRGAAISLANIPRRQRLIFLQLRMLDRTIPIELKREVDWVNALEDGDAEALFEVALRARDGNGMPRNVRAAITWLFDASRKGFVKARYEIAQMAFSGKYDSPLLKSGMVHLFFAAEAGYVPAQVELGLRFEAGQGAKQWDYAALVWLLKAQANGADVNEAIGRIGARLEPLQRGAAKRAVGNPDGGPFPDLSNHRD